MKRIYLAGPITEDSRTHQWRQAVVKKLHDKFDIDNPCSSRFDKAVFKGAQGNALKIHELVDKYQAEILLPKSYQSVIKADVVLVNFAIEPSDRPMIGTIMEVAWAYVQHKTVIAVRGQGYYTRHPMIKGCVNAWAETIEEAIGILQEFYSSKK